MNSTSRAYFEQMYRDNVDPWGFESSAYEQRKYAVTVASLPRTRYRSAYEPGCSVGVLTELLAVRCDRLLCSDIIPAALAARRGPSPDRGPMSWFEERSIPDQWPTGPFDLVVLSEIAYYFDEMDLGRVLGVRRGLDSARSPCRRGALARRDGLPPERGPLPRAHFGGARSRQHCAAPRGGIRPGRLGATMSRVEGMRAAGRRGSRGAGARRGGAARRSRWKAWRRRSTRCRRRSPAGSPSCSTIAATAALRSHMRGRAGWGPSSLCGSAGAWERPAVRGAEALLSLWPDVRAGR